MLSPVGLSLHPSCHNAISWSPEGELAIAAGEYFQILTPKNGKGDDSAPNSTQDWRITRVRANQFTNSEWPVYLPGKRDDFSIAADLSEGNVIGISWSPAGLGKYRRSVLAVLTSNLVLSIWEPVGSKDQWTRVSVVNHELRAHLQPPQDPDGHIYRKANIRSFAWCESLKPSVPSDGSSFLHSHESRWGIPLLTVVNDCNQVTLLRVRRSDPMNSASGLYDFQIMAQHSLKHQETRNISLCSGSLLEKVINEGQRTTALSCGPWQSLPASSPGDFGRAVAMVAAVCGRNLELMMVEVNIGSSPGETSENYTLATDLTGRSSNYLKEKCSYHNITGPLQWIYDKSSTTIDLAVGVMAGFIVISMSHATYHGGNADFDAFELRHWPLYEPETEENRSHQQRHLEPISAMLTSTDSRDGTCKFHLGTLGGLGLMAELHQLQSGNALRRPKWKLITEEYQEDYDLENDLGEMSVSRIWGLAAYRNVTAAIFTSHPTDIIEYRITSDDRSLLVFSEEGEHTTDPQALFAPQTPDCQTANWNQTRELIRFVLPGDGDDIGTDMESQRLVYAVACRAIVGEEDKSLRAHVQHALEHLALVTGADLSEEISKCKDRPSPVPAKSEDQLNGKGGHIYERCEVCDAAIGWPSIEFAQCGNGHRWVRCGLSFLAIQQPGVSKYCSLCRMEALDEERVACVSGGKQGRTFNALFETFDVCSHCAAKFQASY
ncbi:Transcription factor IIIC zinc-finger [Penicillium bovifimosum]|uniref:Transcription factor IIIC zinc-finger n=1 Tax=Penicillium bovifimosum TaxID=126998 RepID=A0A9W9L5D9_9EURO|nr:Transcription factor IIIC zinc-finger [Penicillium bovifimosum]KAJ5138239.1 Transcription factor IIIC zinc-finger [Penicillium bovifimosum]